jgi:hypothetical protein
VIQAILRHEDVKTTQKSYVKTMPAVVTQAMKRPEGKIGCAAYFDASSRREERDFRLRGLPRE